MVKRCVLCVARIRSLSWCGAFTQRVHLTSWQTIWRGERHAVMLIEHLRHIVRLLLRLIGSVGEKSILRRKDSSRC